MHLKPCTTTTAMLVALGIAIPSTAAAGATTTSPAVLPNPDQQQLKKLSQPAPPQSAASTTVQPNPDQQPAASTTPAVIVRTGPASSGFDWGDAGIGAAGTIGLAAIALGGALAITQRRTRRARRSADATG
jgi:hypothetical protein